MSNLKKNKYVMKIFKIGENFFSIGYFTIPLVAFFVCLFFVKKMELANSIDFKDIINWSITFAGFLFTSFSIIISIPDNRFINKLREKRLYRNILISYGITIMVQISISILIIFKIRDNFVLSLFITTLVESIVLIVYLLKIAYYSSRAK